MKKIKIELKKIFKKPRVISKHKPKVQSNKKIYKRNKKITI